eukprot:TRINITY_DN13256_c0_g2_i1.p3 TRINITY_DN13256_c0_g2~~TRINITY_DN13256_c0_g2_i1.p3  ORF type:complete len:119 (-),score=41.78 TRINITY_DN13256_c0_g2_i1:41-397(-)
MQQLDFDMAGEPGGAAGYGDHSDGRQAAGEPLAARMRPETLDEYAGQKHILAEGKLLRRAIDADQFTSIILSGPPGIGKTLSLIHISEPTRPLYISYAVFCLKKKKIKKATKRSHRLS